MTILSVVKIIFDTDTAFSSAVLVTLAGSTIPFVFISTNSPLAALYPIPTLDDATLSNIIAGSSPAFIAICLSGVSNALSTILPPTFSASSSLETTFETFGIIST